MSESGERGLVNNEEELKDKKGQEKPFDPDATGEFVSMGPVDEFKDSIKDIYDRVEIFKKADEKTRPLKSLRKKRMKYQGRVEEANQEETETTIQNEKEIQQLEDQINAIEEYAQKKVADNIKQENT